MKEIYQYVKITWLLLTGKHLCWSLFLILSIAKFLRAPILKNICEPLLLKMCSWNWEKLFIRSFNFTLKNGFFHDNMIGISWLVSHKVGSDIQYFFGVVRNSKRRSKVQEKNMSCERVLNFDQLKTFYENCKTMRVWLWFVYIFTVNYWRLRLFSEFIQTQKRYPTSLDKIRILT